MDELELTDVIRKLREDLQAAVAEGEGKGVRMQLDSVELELKIAAKKGKDGNAGIKFHVFSLGGAAKLESEQVQTIKLKMVPRTQEGTPVLVADQTVGRPAVPDGLADGG